MATNRDLAVELTELIGKYALLKFPENGCFMVYQWSYLCSVFLRTSELEPAAIEKELRGEIEFLKKNIMVLENL